MRDCLAIGHFPCGSLGIDMNPLVIGRRFGELVNSMLIDDDPVGQADLFAFERLRIFNGLYDSQIRSPPCAFLKSAPSDT
jgi:hypothetical protein